MTQLAGVSILQHTMNGWQHKRSFVIRFRPETDPDAGVIDGRIEHVASGKTTRFTSFEELEDFLNRVLKVVRKEFQEADTLADFLSSEAVTGDLTNERDSKT